MPITAALHPPISPAAVRCQRCAARQQCLIGQLPIVHQHRLDPWISEFDTRKGSLLQDQGTAAEVLRVVKLGTVMLTRIGPDGVGRPVGVAGRGHLLGPWPLLDQPTPVGAVALSTGRVCELPLQAIDGLLWQEPTFVRLLHSAMAQAHASLADWGQIMRLRGLPRQLVAALLLLTQAQGAAAVRLPSQVALAALLNTSRESVARTLSYLQNAGWLHRIDRWHAELTGNHRAVFDDVSSWR